MHKHALALALCVVACDSGPKPGTTTSASAPKPSASTAAGKPSASAKASASAAPSAADSAEPDDAEPAAGVPAEVTALKLPEGSAPLKLKSLELFSFSAPKGTKVADMPPNESKWVSMDGGGLTLSIKAHNPSGDEGPDCPKVDAMKAKVAGAKFVLDKKFKTENVELSGGKTETLGDEVEIFIFEKDGKFGFYGRKLFDHGDDATTFCCAQGKPEEAPELKAVGDEATAKSGAAVCMSLKFTY